MAIGFRFNPRGDLKALAAAAAAFPETADAEFNVAYGLPRGVADALLSVWVPAAYVGCLELWAWMRQHTGMQPRTTRPASAAASPIASADAPDDLQDRREHKASGLLIAAEQAFPEARNGGRVPSCGISSGCCPVGQPRTQQVQAHFRGLQAASMRHWAEPLSRPATGSRAMAPTN